MIPESFGDWQVDRSIVPLLISPDVQAKLDKIYNQTLARTYVNSKGQRVMLSVAYGGDQSDSMRAHRPEVCYAAQGFNITQALLGELHIGQGVLPVRRLVAVHGRRNEPITYWMVVGDQIAVSGLAQKLAQLRYGLTGTVPDGMLVRVSTIDSDESRAFGIQDAFVESLLKSVGPAARIRVAGRVGE
jgi:EpsI family protein